MAFEWVEIVIEYPSRDNFSSFISEIEIKLQLVGYDLKGNH